MPYRKKGDLTIKERKFIKAYIQTGSKKKASLAVYNAKNDHNASEIAKQVLKRPIVKEYLAELLSRKGLALENNVDLLHNSINYNLKNGKPSQAVGMAGLQFAFKLLDAIPANKTLSASVRIGDKTTPKTMSEIAENLKKLANSNEAILKEISK